MQQGGFMDTIKRAGSFVDSRKKDLNVFKESPNTSSNPKPV